MLDAYVRPITPEVLYTKPTIALSRQLPGSLPADCHIPLVTSHFSLDFSLLTRHLSLYPLLTRHLSLYPLLTCHLTSHFSLVTCHFTHFSLVTLPTSHSSLLT
ncbi:hypothetical protein BH10BAC6_BH10BAC6_09360 [soil metagenome]